MRNKRFDDSLPNERPPIPHYTAKTECFYTPFAAITITEVGNHALRFDKQ